MNPRNDRWYTVAEVWLIIVLLLGTMAGSLALVATAFRHQDELPHPRALASPLPPTSAARPADQTGG